MIRSRWLSHTVCVQIVDGVNDLLDVGLLESRDGWDFQSMNRNPIAISSGISIYFVYVILDVKGMPIHRQGEAEN